MQLLYRIAADVVVVVHFSYVAFVILGFLLTLIGILARWNWVRNPVFRTLHLLAILLVAAEALGGITCPLTTWEYQLRSLAGEATYQGAFIAKWVHELLFYEAEPWVFTVCYSLFGLAVLLTFLLAPPRWRRRRS
jgi:hypothetical protein